MNIREEQRGLREFENRLLRKIFGTMREEVTGGFGRLHNGHLYSLYLLSFCNRQVGGFQVILFITL
jgi:hypothetical protein